MKKAFTLIIFITILAGTNLPVHSQNKKPNVVIIFMDDMGYGDLESYGGMPYTTPHTTKIASEGMRFTHFYAAQATCTASRAALLTGCYPNRLSVYGAFSPWSKIALHPQEETLAEILKKEGYKTSMVGKWHLGSKQPHLPLQQGFDEYLGLPYSNDMWPVNYDGKPITDPSNRRIKYPPLPLIDGNEPIKNVETLEDQSELTTLYTERAVEFIRNNKQNPFFLYVAHSMPHVPIAASGKFKGKSGAGLFGDVMMELDWSVGEILSTLDELGLSENTLVIFTSDNGPWLNYGNHAGNTGGLREGKGTSWEGGVRVPAIMRWKGKIPAGTVSNKIASTIDILPTVARLCGANLPSRKIDGVDISSLLFNEKNANPRDHFVYYYGINNLEGVRKDHWKLVFPHEHRTYKKNPPGQDGWPGAQPKDTAEIALYNLQTDPGETLDLKEEFPQVVAELEKLANKYRDELGDDLTRHEGKERRPAARVE
jgi:arylsulfatase A-like enzyme